MDEEDFFPNLRKESRLERKLAQKLDRSRYKKTDLSKVKPEVIERPEHIGRVLAIGSQNVQVIYKGKIETAVVRGSLKQDKARLKNLVAVGDEVILQEGMIIHVLPRRSILSRKDHLHKHKEQLIAANVD